MTIEGEIHQFGSEAERQVWERLGRTVSEDTVLIPNFRLTDAFKDYELDVVVLMPDVGIVVLEVKGGQVWVDEQGRWQQGNGTRKREIRPLDQCRDGKYALRAYVESDPRWKESSRTRVRWGHSIVLPFTDLAADFAVPDCPRWAVHGRVDQADLAGRLHDVVEHQASGHRRPDDSDIALLREILTGRSFPAYDITAVADEREAAADRLTQQQAALLQVTRLINRMEVRGGAGSGKTILALTQAKDLTRGQGERRPQRVALVCYSIGLSEYFKRQLEGVPRRHRPAFVGSFEDLARHWGVTAFADRDDSDFWEVRLPGQMRQIAEQLPESQRFDAIIVDEAQDFADHWWHPLMRALKDEETGGLYVYSDENQRIFARFGQPPVPLVPLVLDHNLRNTQEIAKAFGPLAPMRMQLKGGHGAEVKFVPCATAEAIATADDQVDLLLDDGWKPQHVALLTVGSRHPAQAELQESRGHVGYWQSFWEDDDVFYGHVLGCKGLERKAVVLCVNPKNTERAKEMLYVGMSRATDQLVVVGDPALIREIGGEQVARQLGIGG
ncbi:MAG TPA: NERD domain-containing protein [Dermatophilaceae bacterium]|nr:NERD domain-containing protein [Dermatophilaceae bacterium]